MYRVATLNPEARCLEISNVSLHQIRHAKSGSHKSSDCRRRGHPTTSSAHRARSTRRDSSLPIVPSPGRPACAPPASCRVPRPSIWPRHPEDVGGEPASRAPAPTSPSRDSSPLYSSPFYSDFYSSRCSALRSHLSLARELEAASWLPEGWLLMRHPSCCLPTAVRPAPTASARAAACVAPATAARRTLRSSHWAMCRATSRAGMHTVRRVPSVREAVPPSHARTR